MKIKLLIAAQADYAEYLSSVLSTKYAETFAVGLCSSKEMVSDTLASKKYDIVLIESGWISAQTLKNVRMPLELWSGEPGLSGNTQNIVRINKYRRISALVSDILEQYASVAPGFADLNKEKGKVIAVWSPAGGAGKTTVALACATRNVSDGHTVTYLDLEHFPGTDAYFPNEGKSISLLFDKLASNADILVKSIRQHDAATGIDYFSPPVNYDDINELRVEDMTGIVNICSRASDVVVVDLPCVCDWRTQAVLDMADTILLVSDGSRTTAAKLNVFISQHSVFENIKSKILLVLNKGAKQADPVFEKAISLPDVQTRDPVIIFKTLSGNSFNM